MPIHHLGTAVQLYPLQQLRLQMRWQSYSNPIVVFHMKGSVLHIECSIPEKVNVLLAWSHYDLKYLFEILIATICIRWNIIFLLHYIHYFAVCGGNYHTSTGVIHSPGWPENYAHGLDCSWIIHAPINQQIELNFTKFSLENHTNCDYDFLEV